MAVRMRVGLRVNRGVRVGCASDRALGSGQQDLRRMAKQRLCRYKRAEYRLFLEI